VIIVDKPQRPGPRASWPRRDFLRQRSADPRHDHRHDHHHEIGHLPYLKIVVTHRTDATWIRLRGEVDYSNRPLLRAALTAVDLHRTGVLHLDLEHLDFCDVGGCRLLLLLERKARRLGYETRIHGARDTVRKVLCLIAGRDRPTFA